MPKNPKITLKGSIGERIDKIISYFQTDITNFAKNIGYSHSNISRIRSGHKPLSKFVSHSISLTYGINKHWLLTGEGEMFEHKPEMVAETRPVYGTMLDEIFKRVKIIYEEGDFEARAKVMGFINAVYDDMLRIKEKKKLEAPNESEYDKGKEVSPAAEGEDVRDNAGSG